MGGKGKLKPASGDRFDKDNWITMARELSGMTAGQVETVLREMDRDMVGTPQEKEDKYQKRLRNFREVEETLDVLEDDPTFSRNREKEDTIAFGNIRQTLNGLVGTNPGYVRPEYDGPGKIKGAPDPSATTESNAQESASGTATSADDLIIPRS